MSFPAQTTGLGVAAKIAVAGNLSGNTKPGYNNLVLSVSGVNAPSTFQLNPQLEDVAGNEVVAGTPLVLTAVANSSVAALVLTAAAINGVYTGTITGGGSNALAGTTFIVAGFTDAANNGEFIATASTTTTLTLANANSVVETHAATATYEEGTAVYTGTITGGGSNALAGKTFVVAGFTGANNNGTFIATASGTTTLTLENAAATSETHAATATAQETTNSLTFVEYGFKTITPSQATGPNGTPTQHSIATVSATGLVTAVAQGGTVVEVSYPTFNNSVGDVVSSGNIMNGLPINKVYAELNVTVIP
jgi:hypothetical protein